MDKKPGIGYSPMQEFYCHRPVDMIRIDFMEKALLGNVLHVIFVQMFAQSMG